MCMLVSMAGSVQSKKSSLAWGAFPALGATGRGELRALSILMKEPSCFCPCACLVSCDASHLHRPVWQGLQMWKSLGSSWAKARFKTSCTYARLSLQLPAQQRMHWEDAEGGSQLQSCPQGEGQLWMRGSHALPGLRVNYGCMGWVPEGEGGILVSGRLETTAGISLLGGRAEASCTHPAVPRPLKPSLSKTTVYRNLSIDIVHWFLKKIKVRILKEQCSWWRGENGYH